MKGKIFSSGIDLHDGAFSNLSATYEVEEISSPPGSKHETLKEADVYLIGPSILNPVKEIQGIYSADKQLSIILLVPPTHVKQVKQTIQFAPFIGNNVMVVANDPELNLLPVLEGAVQRTRQKRSFSRINRQINGNLIDKKVKLEDLGSFLEYAPVAAILLNEQEQVVSFNRQAKKFFSNLEISGAGLMNLFFKEEAESIKDFIYDGHHPETRLHLAIGQKFFELTSSEVYNEVGSKNFLLLLHDVTDQKLESQRIYSILEALPQMAWTTDAEGRATYFTKGWYYYTGQTPNQALANWIEVVYEEDVKKLRDGFSQSIKTGIPFQQAARYRNIKGEYRWHLVRASGIRSKSGISMWVGTCTDIHDQVLLTEELERKVKERTHELELTNIELEQFAHISSHDLQEPLRKIRTFAEILKDTAYNQMDSASQRYIDKINNTAARMSETLRALLNFTKMHREERQADVDLNEVITQVLVDLELLIHQKGATIQIDHLPKIRAVTIQIQQLFYNLLNNALKFSKSGTSPHIQVKVRTLDEEELMAYKNLERFRTWYEFTVIDNGIGFDQQYAEKIFTIFQRLHNRKEYEGTGIGLSLVKKVISNHGGEIHAHSSPGKGARFVFTLPGVAPSMD